MNGYRILIIDGDAPTVAMVKEGLELGGYEVRVATNGSAGLQWLDQAETDLVILDGQLTAGMDTRQVLRRIRDHQQHFNLPVIVLSGADHPTEKVWSLNLGADDYVVKPFHYDEFMARIKAVLRRCHRFRTIESAMSGLLSEMSLSVLIQTLSLSARTGIISLSDENATVVFREGQVINATYHEHEGLDALRRLFLGAAGQFQIEFDQVPETTALITQRTEHLMLNLTHEADELGAAIHPVPSIDTRLVMDSAEDVPEPLRGVFQNWQPLAARRLLTLLNGNLLENAHMLALLYGLGSIVESPEKT